jgi:glycosyltransferase involved in cell wall biosynthesis
VNGAAPLASVVIPTLDAGEGFAETLAAVRAQQGVGEVDLVVVDSESRDGTAERARRAGARVRRILRPTFNHGHTRNLGVALARGRFVGFLTQDALPADGRWLGALIDALERDAAVGAYSRVVARPGASPLIERQVRDDLVHSTRREVKRATRDQIERLAPLERRILFHFNNVASCVRRDAFARAPFPALAFGEDLAWGERMVRAGEAIVFEPGSLVFHSHAGALAAEYARHKADAALLRQLFGLVLRRGLEDGLARWRNDVARDFAFVRALPLPWHVKLRHCSWSPFLRAAQVAGQVAGGRVPPGAAPDRPVLLPCLERRAEAE